MTTKAVRALIFFTFCSLFFAASGCREAEHVSLWDRHCGVCHDGKTILNGRVVANKDQLRAKFKTLDEFSNACSGPASGSCMNILKHDKKLFIEVGREIGISDTPKKTDAAMLPSNGAECTP